MPSGPRPLAGGPSGIPVFVLHAFATQVPRRHQNPKSKKSQTFWQKIPESPWSQLSEILPPNSVGNTNSSQLFLGVHYQLGWHYNIKSPKNLAMGQKPPQFRTATDTDRERRQSLDCFTRQSRCCSVAATTLVQEREAVRNAGKRVWKKKAGSLTERKSPRT